MDSNEGDRKLRAEETRIMQHIVRTNNVIAQNLLKRQKYEEGHPETILVNSNADGNTSVVSDMNSSAKSKKRCQADPRISDAAKVYLISQSTNVKKDLTQSLVAVGFTSEELSDKGEMSRLKKCVSSAASLLKNQEMPLLVSPCVVLNQFNKARIKLVEEDEDTLSIMQHLHKSSVLYNNGAWGEVNKSNLTQWVVKNYNHLGKKKKGLAVKTMFSNLFKKHGFTIEEKGIQYKEMLCTALYTRNQDYTPQEIHTDFPLKSVEDGKGGEQFLAWTAHLPLTEEGSWIWVWSGPGIGGPLHIKMGQILYLRSDVVHAGGRPPVDKLEDQKYLRLHFYLPTEYQPVPNDRIYFTDHDQWTLLKDSYAFPNIMVELIKKEGKK